MESLSESAPKPSWDLHGMFHIFVARTRLNVFDMQSRLRCKWEISLKNHGDKDADHHAAPPLLEGPPPWLIALRRIRWAVESGNMGPATCSHGTLWKGWSSLIHSYNKLSWASLVRPISVARETKERKQKMVQNSIISGFSTQNHHRIHLEISVVEIRRHEMPFDSLVFVKRVVLEMPTYKICPWLEDEAAAKIRFHFRYVPVPPVAPLSSVPDSPMNQHQSTKPSKHSNIHAMLKSIKHHASYTQWSVPAMWRKAPLRPIIGRTWLSSLVLPHAETVQNGPPQHHQYPHLLICREAVSQFHHTNSTCALPNWQPLALTQSP